MSKVTLSIQVGPCPSPHGQCSWSLSESSYQNQLWPQNGLARWMFYVSPTSDSMA